MDIIDQLRRAIKRSGKSQAEIARKTGIDQGNLNRFANGNSSMTLDNAAKIAKYLRLKLR
jgi:transcriptional regulator with XRE-family HTH domain